ncbi:oxidoreductase [Herbiconiux sp. CPCC 205763]|uniref:Oxidoreductase n=1 Tax=Herbiconiux aconitum TaxID=2970913 RepID=A0ABT2GUT6_9MICO|nr:oxidoreductase [Herbiconiux aconitum]MCS5719975.1 oxidoreductase [Herbiconiux aconitum]
MANRWTQEQVPDQLGRRAVITGGNAGLGFELASLLLAKGAAVTMVSRSAERAASAAESLRSAHRGAEVDAVLMEQGSLASVRHAAADILDRHERVDLLINNAGMLGSAERRVSPEGFELTFATNHLGVFAFTGLLIGAMTSTPGSRVVTMSSISNARSRLDFDNLMADTAYDRNGVYSRSKLANLMFAYGLQRRLAAGHADTVSLAAHPGQSRTEFTRDLSPLARFLYGPRARWLTGLIMQDKSIGVLSPARAATDPAAIGGEYYGPAGPFQLTGYPTRVDSNTQSKDPGAQDALWQASERLTGITYPLPPVPGEAH